ncbi:hypothetical protein K9U40_21700 [Xanthobacter autotrophicus]|uniref:hypothetical protein n=1 Tax=Xanthobacter TaxID=279 RepID=UPI0024AC1A43|nr:hypothetical protein [Xanthobacter autotrophicus]MDI4666915.1 hypothetical protein [Xanthobacter autotrophicus]
MNIVIECGLFADRAQSSYSTHIHEQLFWSEGFDDDDGVTTNSSPLENDVPRLSSVFTVHCFARAAWVVIAKEPDIEIGPRRYLRANQTHHIVAPRGTRLAFQLI